MTAIRHGKFKGIETGRDLLPPMHWYIIVALSIFSIKPRLNLLLVSQLKLLNGK